MKYVLSLFLFSIVFSCTQSIIGEKEIDQREVTQGQVSIMIDEGNSFPFMTLPAGYLLSHPDEFDVRYTDEQGEPIYEDPNAVVSLKSSMIRSNRLLNIIESAEQILLENDGIGCVVFDTTDLEISSRGCPHTYGRTIYLTGHSTHTILDDDTPPNRWDCIVKKYNVYCDWCNSMVAQGLQYHSLDGFYWHY